MRLTLRTLTRSWKLKLAALSLAVLLWVVVSAEQATTQWIPVVVRVAMRDRGHVVTDGPAPAQVEVRFAGPGRELWELALEDPVVVLPIDQVRRGSGLYALDPRMVRVRPGLTVTAQEVRPASVRVLTQPLATREVPVRVRISRRSRARYALVGPPVVTPARVRVTGRADRVARLGAVVTRPLDLAGSDTVYAQSMELDPDSLNGLRPSVARVRVTGRVRRTGPAAGAAPLAGGGVP